MTKHSLLALALFAGTATSAQAQVAGGGAGGGGGDWAEAERAELAADAATRTSLVSGSEQGLLSRQPDAGITFSGQFQFRYTLNVRDDEGNEEGFTHGFSVRRAKLIADTDLNETWSVHLQGAFDRDGGSFELEDAWADWELDDSWTLRFGQFKAPTLAEELASSKRMQAVDRSETNEVFNLDRTQGVMAIYTADKWDFMGSFNTGANTDNTEFNGANNADYGFTGRAEWIFGGDRDQLKDFSGWQGQEYAGKAGGAVHYQDGGSTGVGSVGSTPDVSFIQATVDAQVEGNGWNAFGAFIWNHIDPSGGDELDNFGIVAQGGVFISASDELFGRYDVIVPDSDTPGGDDSFNTITVGWNHYFIPESHASKFQLDLQWFLNATSDTGLVNANPGIGLLDSANENQFAIRAQYAATF
jgi:hypothetical protein